MRVVLDTNIWLLGMLWGRVPGQVLQRVENKEIQAIGSEEILDELTIALDRNVAGVTMCLSGEYMSTPVMP